MEKMIYTLNLGHSRVSASALVEMSRTNVNMLDGNAAFPMTLPPLSDLRSATDRLEAALADYGFNPSRLGKQERDTAFRELKNLRKELGSYVQARCQGDKELISSAGFEVERERQRAGLLPAPTAVRATSTKFPGEIRVNFKGVRGRLYYQVFICVGSSTAESKWQFHASTSKNRMVVTGLKSYKAYSFRVVAVGTAGASPVSGQATGIAI